MLLSNSIPIFYFSEKLNKYYIGFTNGIEERLERHLSSSKGFTAKAKDWEVKHYEIYSSRFLAVKREMSIKKWKSRKIIEKLFNPE